MMDISTYCLALLMGTALAVLVPSPDHTSSPETVALGLLNAMQEIRGKPHAGEQVPPAGERLAHDTRGYRLQPPGLQKKTRAFN